MEMYRAFVSADKKSVCVAPACPVCGNAVVYGSRFCGTCGEDLAHHKELSVEGAECVLCTEGGFAEIVPATAGPADTVEIMLKHSRPGMLPEMQEGVDAYRLFDTTGGVPSVIGCPLGQSGFCQGPDKACDDLVGYLCMRQGDRLYACASLCHACVTADTLAG